LVGGLFMNWVRFDIGGGGMDGWMGGWDIVMTFMI
jgi:hypothetical protein